MTNCAIYLYKGGKHDINNQNLYYIDKEKQNLKIPKTMSFLDNLKKSRANDFSPTRKDEFVKHFLIEEMKDKKLILDF